MFGKLFRGTLSIVLTLGVLVALCVLGFVIQWHEDTYDSIKRKQGQTYFLARGKTKEQYIAYLRTTRPADSLKLQRRIQAVKDLPEWP